MSFLDRIRQTIARYQLLHAGDSVGVAVSGGADSVCLLRVLFELRAEFALRLAVVHADHNLRGPESQADAEFVRACAAELGLAFHLRILDLPRAGNLEQAARQARYQYFGDLIAGGTVGKIAVGHTRSDQAETVLFRLLRGAGSAGLAAIRPITGSGIIRPLLQVTRTEVEQYLKERAIPWRQDSTNAELRFDRNRIRHQLIPALEADWNPEIQENLAQTADWAWEEERYWEAEIRRLLAENWVRIAHGEAVVDADRLRSLPVAVARRLIREIVRQVKGNLLGLSFSHVESIREVDRRCQVTGVEIVKSYNWIRFVGSPAPPPLPDWQLPVTVPGCYTVPPGTHSIALQRIDNDGVYNGSLDALDGERAGGLLVLRNWRAGDRYRRQGHTGAKKLKSLFEERRIPLWDRRNWPVISVGNAVVWARGFGPAAEFAVNPESKTVLTIRETREGAEKV